MGDDGGTAGPRYRAFISYSHRDAAFGRRLHRRLEGYAMPRRLVGRPGRLGPVPARLAPIFRDREELSAADDLSAEVRAALASSGSLIVVCSPAAAASSWVGREIEAFRALHPGRPVLAALAEGDPAQAFPAALRAHGGEPLAADFRREGDGPRPALLKLAAGVAGVGLDELVQRDAQRRVARVTAVTGAAVAGMLAMGVMTAIALDARAEAERQRAEAEGLVEFMLTDLRDQLKGVGRLGIMGGVNERALAHYAAQRRLTPEQLAQRAAIHHAMGEDYLSRGEPDRALAEFEQAQQETTALLAADPDDPDRIYIHAQSEYWMARVAFEKQQFDAARRGFATYRALAGRLVAVAPSNPRYRREVGFAEGNLCSVAFKQPEDAAAGLRHCAAALSSMEAVARTSDRTPQIMADIVNRHAWLADAYRLNGDDAKALDERLMQERLLARLMADDPQNMDYRDTWLVLQQALAGLEFKDGRVKAARTRMLEARKVAAAMRAFDPENERWRKIADGIEAGLKYIDDNSN